MGNLSAPEAFPRFMAWIWGLSLLMILHCPTDCLNGGSELKARLISVLCGIAQKKYVD